MSNEAVRALEPKAIWNHFADLNAIPRASKKEARVTQFMKAFGEGLKLPTYVDHAGNVIIKKPGTKGKENKPAVVLQGHLDMVHQKNADTNFNFDTEGIKMKVDGDWVKAEGTTLGADNGLGVASIMTVLASTDISHPPIEALFTVDEETGMTGAFELKGGLLSAPVLLNLDTEDDDELTIGCAGGVDVTAKGTYAEETTPAGHGGHLLSITGLNGGHSGAEIHLGFGNANKIMDRLLLLGREHGLRLASVDGGGLRNAIPRESNAVVALPTGKEQAFGEAVKLLETKLKDEYRTTDPHLKVALAKTEAPAKVMAVKDQQAFLLAVQACPDGIFRMSPDVPGLVQTSNNVARVQLGGGSYTVMCLTRGSVESEKMDQAETIRAAFALIGGTVEFTGGYPGWAPKPDAPIVKLMADTYQDLFQEKLKVLAIHAGLECGIIGRNYPQMEMVSFGPTIKGPHSPDERASIKSLQKFWKYLQEVLVRL
ncbi:MAG: aminoacyl-histidine dipeptidase [Bacteroidetes bacterium]|nr:aminoacyl-histidine dipeptidase [Bacteroidota bacterium]MBS1940740.1 aminoacyl-histidine dipeptidase [Bacteroidota bacterium]